MSDYKPITGELRKYAALLHDEGSAALARIKDMCDAIDAIHAQLERENAELRDDLQRMNAENAKLRKLLAKMDNRGGSMHIGETTVTVKPTLDWSGVAQELRAIADTLAGDAS